MGTLALKGGKRTLSSPFPWPLWNDAERTNLIEVLESGHWGCLSGKRVAEFEAAFAEYHDAKYCICTSSGTTALETAMLAWGLCPGDEVIIPAYTFVATATAVANVNAVPIFADVDPFTYNLDPRSAEEKITPKTKAIVAVHIGGNPANLNTLRQIAEKHNLLLLEDAAQAAGAIYGGRKVGAIGHIGCFSFQATKNLNCGEGGAIITDNAELAAKCRSIINCGRPDPDFHFTVQGTNFRMTEFQAAVLLGQLTRFDKQSDIRDATYKVLESGIKAINGLMPATKEPETDRRGCHLFMFSYNQEEFGGLERDIFVSALNAEGVPCCSGYTPLYRNELFEAYDSEGKYRTLFLPVAEELANSSIWIFQQVLLGTPQEMELIIKAVKKIRENQFELQ